MEIEQEGYAVVGLVEEGCSTPKQGDCQIPAAAMPPPPPRKKQCDYGGKRNPPKNGYFHPPELELIFDAKLVLKFGY